MAKSARISGGHGSVATDEKRNKGTGDSSTACGRPSRPPLLPAAQCQMPCSTRQHACTTEELPKNTAMAVHGGNHQSHQSDTNASDAKGNELSGQQKVEKQKKRFILRFFLFFFSNRKKPTIIIKRITATKPRRHAIASSFFIINFSINMRSSWRERAAGRRRWPGKT
jgi:hypothetical protein